MKKTINVNLGGQAFIIDEPAFEILHTYFESLKQKFQNETERKEIMEDIENRVAEVFQQRLGRSKDVVTEEDVVHVVRILGKPEDIAGDDQSSSTTAENPTPTMAAESVFKGPREKKLFRDEDDKKIGGVISGLCHYFGWGDPTWVRIAVVGVFLISHFAHLHLGFPMAVLYFILLVVVPKARTATDKLQMRGEPVTIKNIEREVRDAMYTASNSVKTVVNDNRVMSGAATGVQIFAKVVLVFVVICCLGGLVALFSGFVGVSLISGIVPVELTKLFIDHHNALMWWNLGILLTFGIPLVGIIYKCIRYITDNHSKNKYIGWAMTILWFAGLGILVFISRNVWRDFTTTATVNQPLQIAQPSKGALYIDLMDTFGNSINVNSFDDNEESVFMISGIAESDYGYTFGSPKMELAVSPDSSFHMEQIVFSRGRNVADAKKNIADVRYKFSQSDSVIKLDNKFEISKNGKWRAQRVKLRIAIPEGHHIHFGKNIDELEAIVKGDRYFNDIEFANGDFSVKEGKVICSGCETQDDQEETKKHKNSKHHGNDDGDDDDNDY